MLSQFSNLSCYEEFEIRSALTGISKIDILKEIGHKVNDYYFFISEDGIFNWFDLKGNHIENPGVLKELKNRHIHYDIIKCIIPDSTINISDRAFSFCKSLVSITIPNGVTSIGHYAFSNCELLKEIIIPDSVENIGCAAFFACNSLKKVIFKGKTLDEVKRMVYYPFGIKDESIIKCEI